MRIGIFSDTYLPDINGVVTSITQLKIGLESMGHQVFVIANHNSLFEVKLVDDILYLPGLYIKKINNKMSSPWQNRAIKYIKDMNLDIIHVQTEFGVGLFARKCAKKLAIPLVYTYHTTWEDYTHYLNPLRIKSVEKVLRKMVRLFSKKLCNPAQAVIVPSKKTFDLLASYGVELPMHLIPTGLDLKRFDQPFNSVCSQYNIPENATVAIFVGRISVEKNIEVLLEAFRQLTNNNIYLLIVGAGPSLEHIKHAVELYNLNKVICTGSIANDKIVPYYRSADCFISASLTETQGLTFIEALASHNVLFGADKEVLDNLLIEKYNGYYFEDANDLAQKLIAFSQLSTQEKEELQSNATKSVIKYGRLAFAKAVYHVYESVINHE